MLDRSGPACASSQAKLSEKAKFYEIGFCPAIYYITITPLYKSSKLKNTGATRKTCPKEKK
jgi:hypothetical protein